MRALAFSLLGLVLGSACIDVDVPSGVILACAEDSECPDGFLCRQQIGVCVAATALEDDPPTVSDVALQDPLVKADEDIVVTFVVSEPLFVAPTVELGFSDRKRPAVVVVDGDTVTATYRTRGDEPEELVALAARLVDVAGNVAEQVPLASVTVDFSPPGIVAVTSTPALARDGSEVVVRLQGSEPLDDNSTVTLLGGRALSLQGTDPNDALVSIFSLTVDGTVEATGPASLSVVAVDAAGNRAEKTVDGAIAFDFAAPVINAQPAATPRGVGPGGTIIASFTTDELLAASAIVLVDAAGTQSPIAAVERTGLVYIASRPVQPGDVDGSYEVRLASWRDAAGNEGPAPVLLERIALDATLPVFTTPPTTNVTHLSRRPGRDVAVVSFSLSEDASVAARIGARELTCTSDGGVAGSPPFSFTCPYTVTAEDADGVADVTVTATDSAGNSRFATAAPLTFDFTAPQLASATVSPVLAARPGDNVVVSLVANEQLASAIGLTVTGPDGAVVPAGFFADLGGTFLHGVVDGDLEGIYGSRVELVDLAGNVASNLVGPGFALDVSTPLVVTAVVAPAFARTDTVVTLEVHVSEAVGSAPPGFIATIGGRPFDSCVEDGTPNDLLCSYRVRGPGPEREPEGTTAISVVARDTAGNTGFAGASVVIDFTAPALASATVSPALARPGDNVVISLVANEPLALAPALTVLGPATIAFAATGGTFAHGVTAADGEGSYTSTVELQDLAGNVAAAVVGPTFALDTSTPFVLDVQTAPAVASLVAGHDVITITLQLAETIDLAQGGLVVSVGGRPTGPCTAAPGDARTISCSYVVVGDEREGVAAVSAVARDLAGNTDFAGGSVVFDFTAPALASSTVSPALARPGDNVVISVAANEALGADAVLTSAGPGPAVFARNGSTFTHTVVGGGAGDVEGAYTSRIALVDLAGNSATLDGPGFALDVSSPRVVDLTVGPAAVSTINGNNVVTVELLLSEALDVLAPSVVVTVAGNDAPCIANGADPLRATCLYVVEGTEPEGQAAVAVALRDDAGNTGFASDAVVFDFTPPGVVGTVGLTLTPGAGNVLPAVTAVTTGTRITLSFTLSEPTAVTTVATTAPVALSFAERARTGTTFVFDHVLSSTTQGAHTVAVTARDLVGNQATTTLTLPAPGFVVDTVPPAAPSVGTADAITYTRVPFGADATAGARRFTINAVAGAVAGSTLLAYDSVRAEVGRAVVGAAGAGATAVTLSGSDRDEVFVAAVDDAGNESDDSAAAGLQASRVRDVTWIGAYGDKIPGSALENPHTFERNAFSPDDLVALGSNEAGVADGITRAGGGRITNTGAPTFRRAGGLDSPLGRRQPGLAYDSARHRTVLFGGDGLKDDTWEWDGGNWTEILPTDAEGDGRPAPRDGVRLVYDPIREKTIFIGGIRFFPAGLDETWEWNGQSWNRRCDNQPVGDTCTLPPARANHGLVFDARRGKVVMFGGAGDINLTTPKNDTWEWDGTTWTQRCDGVPASDVCGTLPPARHGLAMGYNDVTGKVIVFGGANAAGVNLDDTWEWDGTSWRDISSTPRPSARQGAEMAFDARSSEVLLFGGGTVNSRTGGGGFNDVFSHNGSRWQALTVTDPEVDGTPQGRRFMGMTSTAVDIEIFGGLSNGNCDGTGGACNGVWRWNSGTRSFSDRAADPNGDGGPVRRDRPVLVYDSQRKRTVMFGGVDVSVGNAADSCRGEVGASSQAARCGFTWEWNGARWTKAAGVGVGIPDPRVGHAMAYDRNRGVVVLFGGNTDSAGAGVLCEGSGSGFCPGTWEWNGTVWSKKTPATIPTARIGHAMAFDETRGVVVMFGGVTQGNAACDGIVDCGKLWTWNGTNWIEAAQGNIGDGLPLARERHAMAWDDVRDEIVLFGGLRDALPGGTACNEGFFGVCDDTWSWNGTRWDKLATVGPGSTSTGPTRNFQMVFDRRRQRTVILGGNDNNGGRPESSSEFDGTSWSQRNNADPEGDGTPPGRVNVGLAFDEVEGVVVSFGSVFNDDSTWLWDGGARTGAGHHLAFSFRSAGASANAASTTLLSLSTNLIVGGTGGIGAAVTQGADLYAWDGGQWRVMASNTAPSTTPAALPFSTTDSLFLGRMLTGANKSLRLAVRTDGNAQVSAPSSVTTDLAEVTIRYRLP